MPERWVLTFSPDVYPFAQRVLLTTLVVILSLTVINRTVRVVDSWWKREISFISALGVFLAGMMLPMGTIGGGTLYSDNEQLLLFTGVFTVWFGCCRLVKKWPKYQFPVPNKA